MEVIFKQRSECTEEMSSVGSGDELGFSSL